MPINLEQKQQIASCFAKDYVLNEKDDCVTLFTFKGICNITFKYNENGSAFPGLAIWVFRGRQDFIQKFRAVNNQGFKYNQRQIVKNEGYGWVAFYRDGCKTQQEVYEQIVNPGREKDKWKSFYDYLIFTNDFINLLINCFFLPNPVSCISIKFGPHSIDVLSSVFDLFG